MNKLLQPPLVAGCLGVILGLGVGLGWFWRAADALVADAALRRQTTKEDTRGQGWDFWTVEIDNLASDLKEEKARLRKQADQLDQRAARIAAEQKELDKLRAELEAMRREIGERVIEINADEAKNLRSLAQTYTNLTPKAAVAIIREMDDVTVVKILSLMKSDVVAPVFEEMSRTQGPEGLLARRAAVLSEKLRLMKSTRAGNAS